MANVIIFGVNDTAQLSHYYLKKDSEHVVIGFTVHKKYLQNDIFCNLPVYPFESLTDFFTPEQTSLFAPMTAENMNKLRESVYNQIKAKGFTMISYISSQATVLSEHIGENCFILEDNTIQPFVNIGNNVVLWSGNHIGHHSEIKDHAFISSHVVISGHCSIGEYSFLGVNATLRDGLTIAEGTFIAMASSVTKTTEPWCAYAGTPAKKLRQASTEINIYHKQNT